jgi:hypothetical protein
MASLTTGFRPTTREPPTSRSIVQLAGREKSSSSISTRNVRSGTRPTLATVTEATVVLSAP